MGPSSSSCWLCTWACCLMSRGLPPTVRGSTPCGLAEGEPLWEVRHAKRSGRADSIMSGLHPAGVVPDSGQGSEHSVGAHSHAGRCRPCLSAPTLTLPPAATPPPASPPALPQCQPWGPIQLGRLFTFPSSCWPSCSAYGQLRCYLGPPLPAARTSTVRAEWREGPREPCRQPTPEDTQVRWFLEIETRLFSGISWDQPDHTPHWEDFLVEGQPAEGSCSRKLRGSRAAISSWLPQAGKLMPLGLRWVSLSLPNVT